MKGWETIKLGDTKICFIDGDRSAKYPARSEFVDTGIMFLNAESIKTGRIDQSTVNHITKTKFETITKGRIRKNDVLMTTRGNGIGDVAYVDTNESGLINAQMLILRNEPEEIYPAYLYYFFKTKYSKEQIGIFSSGSAQPQIPITDLKHLPVILPPLPIQRKIAAILSAYDDLIENNNRRIAILEKMAEELYREWFVRLRFPGHEKVKIVKGVPEGWEMKKLQDMPFEIIDGDRGVNYPNKDDFSSYGYCVFLNTGNIKNDKFNFLDCQFITKQKDDVLRKGKLNKNDIIITTRGTVGSIAHYTHWNKYDNVRINSGMIIIRPIDTSSNYLYQTLKSEYMKNQYTLFSSGSAQPQLPIKDFKNILCLLPDITTLKAFDLQVDNIVQCTENISNKNALLTTTRDRLLTRLMSGKIDVENLDIQFPASMKEEKELTYA